MGPPSVSKGFAGESKLAYVLFDVLFALQDGFVGYHAMQGRNSGPTSSAESHPGSSTADLSHVMCLNSNPASVQDIPNLGGGAARGSRQRKRREVEVTDERTLRQQKRMVGFTNNAYVQRVHP